MKEISENEESAQAKVQAHHDAFKKSRVGVYAGGNKYIDKIDEHINYDGSGKLGECVFFSVCWITLHELNFSDRRSQS